MNRFRRSVRPYMRHALALGGIIVVALVIAGYITTHERLRFPWQSHRRLIAEFSSAQAVTPGQGQTVNVAGVEVGEISSVRLEQGRAVVEMNITSSELGPVYRNAHMLLRPKTGLNDMSVSLDPGTADPKLPGGGKLGPDDRLPVWNTLPNVNPDEVLATLDSDTRNYLATVATAGGRGLRGRGPDLKRLIEASEPTVAQTGRIARALADRRVKIARLVHNLRLLSQATASKDRQLASLVSGSTAVFSTIASREGDLGRAVDRLPGALAALDKALTATRAFAGNAQPALAALRPTVRELAPALVQVRPLFRAAEPTLRTRVRPLVRQAIPVVRELRPSVDLVNRADPDLQRTVDVLDYVVNELAYNPPGTEEGYLFWAAWFAHNGSSILSIEDAHGVAWRGLVMIGCSTAGQVIKVTPALAPLGQSAVCPGSGSGVPPLPSVPPLPKKRGGR